MENERWLMDMIRIGVEETYPDEEYVNPAEVEDLNACSSPEDTL